MYKLLSAFLTCLTLSFAAEALERGSSRPSPVEIMREMPSVDILSVLTEVVCEIDPSVLFSSTSPEAPFELFHSDEAIKYFKRVIAEDTAQYTDFSTPLTTEEADDFVEFCDTYYSHRSIPSMFERPFKETLLPAVKALSKTGLTSSKLAEPDKLNPEPIQHLFSNFSTFAFCVQECFYNRYQVNIRPYKALLCNIDRIPLCRKKISEKFFLIKFGFRKITKIYQKIAHLFTVYQGLELTEDGPVTYLDALQVKRVCRQAMPGRFIFLKDINGWLPMFLIKVHTDSRAENRFGTMSMEMGFFPDGFHNKMFVMKDDGDFYKKQGILVSTTEKQMFGKSCMRFTRLNGDTGSPATSYDCKTLGFYYSTEVYNANPKLKALIARVQREFRIPSGRRNFFLNNDKMYSKLLVFMLSFAELWQEIFEEQHGVKSSLVEEMLADFCIELPETEPKPLTKSQKRRQREKRRKERLRAEAEMAAKQQALKEDEKATADEKAPMPSKEEEKKEGKPDNLVQENQETAEITAAVPTVTPTERSVLDRLQNLTQRLMDKIPNGRIKPNQYISVINSWLDICQNETDLQIESVNQRGSHIILHTNKGPFTMVIKHGKKDRTYAPHQLESSVHELASLATGGGGGGGSSK